MDNQGQQKHFFTGGMNSDDEDRFVPEGDYRLLRNARAGFSGAAEILAGSELVSEINEPICEATWTELSRACSADGGKLIVREVDQDYIERTREIDDPVACPYFNTEIMGVGTYLKEGCGTGYLGTAGMIFIAAKAYSSNVSQIDAQAKAQAAYDALDTQAYANAHGNCVRDPAYQPTELNCKMDATNCWTGLMIDGDDNVFPPTEEECAHCNEMQPGKCKNVGCL